MVNMPLLGGGKCRGFYNVRAGDRRLGAAAELDGRMKGNGSKLGVEVWSLSLAPALLQEEIENAVVVV